MSDDVIRWERDDTGVVTLTMDDPEQRVNTLNERFTAAFADLVDRLETERDGPGLTGVVLRSAKSSFLAGGDINRLVAVTDEERRAFQDDLDVRKSRTRRLERLGRPVVALLEGAALGGGLELALCCHHRVGIDSPRVVVGLPEVTLGLLPGGGGLVRSTHLLGPEAAGALALSGLRLSVGDAAGLGLIDEVVASAVDAEAAARAWIAAHPTAGQPWDDGRAVPIRVGPVRDRILATPVLHPDPTLAPAASTIVDLIDRAAREPVDVALAAESTGLADLVAGDVAKRTIGVVFFDTAAARRRARSGDGGPGASTPAPAEVRQHEDRLGDGGRVVEVPAAVASPAVLASLARSGALPFVVAGTDVLAERTAAAVAAVARDLPDADRCLVAAGLAATDAATRPAPADSVTLAGARRLVDAAAAACAKALADGVLITTEDLDVASVRLGGLPAWTGGAARHLATAANRGVA